MGENQGLPSGVSAPEEKVSEQRNIIGCNSTGSRDRLQFSKLRMPPAAILGLLLIVRSFYEKDFLVNNSVIVKRV